MKRIVCCLIVCILFCSLCSYSVSEKVINSVEVLVKGYYFTLLPNNTPLVDFENEIEVWFQICTSIPINNRIEKLEINAVDESETCYRLDMLPTPVPNNLNYTYCRLFIPEQSTDCAFSYLNELAFSYEMVLYDEVTQKTTSTNGTAINSQKWFALPKESLFSMDVYDVVVFQASSEDAVLYSSSEMKEYMEQHPGGQIYWTDYKAKLTKDSDYSFLGAQFLSLSPSACLLKNGIDYEFAYEKTYSDCIDNGEKLFDFWGLIYVQESETIREMIRTLNLFAMFSPEYAGNVDISDAGDRIDSPKKWLKINFCFQSN